MLDKCPGAIGIRTPTIIYKECPECKEEVELFSTDMMKKCSKCGFVIYKDLASCIEWCKYVKECLGEELYSKLKENKK